jgi:phosphatidylglycerol:prolipoprotein diacylglycerol transferase
MYPILLTIGKVSIPTYTVLLDLGLILGLVLTYIEGKRILGSAETALDVGLWTVIGGILGGRIGFVVANSSVFAEDWRRIFRIWEGGLSFHGAFLGGLFVLAVLALLQRRRESPASFWRLADVVTPGLAAGLAFGWLACLMGGCAYGVLGQGVGYLSLPDIYGVTGTRFATQVVGLIQSAVLFIPFWLLRKRWPFAGAAFLMLSLLYFTGQFFLELVRGDEALYVGPWRLPQIFDLALVLLSAVGLLVLWAQSRRGAAEPEAAEQTKEPELLEQTEEPELPKQIEEAIAEADGPGTAEEEGEIGPADLPDRP